MDVTIGKTIKTTRCSCPNCFATLDSVSGAAISGTLPLNQLVPGRVITVCIFCGEVLHLNEEGKFVKASVELVRKIKSVSPPDKWEMLCQMMRAGRNAGSEAQQMRIFNRVGTAWDEMKEI